MNSKIVTTIIKENIVYILPIFVVIFLFINFVVPEISKTFSSFKSLRESKVQFEQTQEQYATLKAQQESQNRKKRVVKDGKIIFEAPGMQLSPDASFAPLFELVLTIAEQSGIRIRSIDYNYAPSEDMVYVSKMEGYNACELNMVAVGTYGELQTFFKTVIKEQYVTNLAELELSPWEKDKKILIAKIKLRLYTRTMAE